jgi:Methylamine utilisation protein MauE
MIDPLPVTLVSIALGVLLAGAAWHKTRSLAGFAAVLADYRLLPPILVAPAARLLPLAEAALAIGWLSGRARTFVAVLTAGLIALYAVAIAVNLLRGRVHISCGCGLGGGSGAEQTLSWNLVLRNVLLVGLSLLPLLPVAQRLLSALDYATLGAALLTTALLYFGLIQLLNNGTAIRAWRNPGD